MTKDQFAALHRADHPLVLFNVWDAGSAKAVADAGATAIATGSLSLAGARGFDDGEAMPFDALLRAVRQIVAAVDLPVTVDFETGYAQCLEDLSTNAAALREAGAIGCNFEDQIIGGQELRDAAEQAERIAIVAGAGLFVNARTDMFLAPLMAGENPNRAELVTDAIKRGAVYKDAGASSFFIPGLSDIDMIAQICTGVDLPVNVMRLPDMPSNAELGAIGVARISYGPAPWREAMDALGEAARELYR